MKREKEKKNQNLSLKKVLPVEQTALCKWAEKRTIEETCQPHKSLIFHAMLVSTIPE